MKRANLRKSHYFLKTAYSVCAGGGLNWKKNLQLSH